MKLNGWHSEALIGSVPGYTVEKIGKIPPVKQVQELLAAHLPDGEHQYQDFAHYLTTIPHSTSGVATSVYIEARNLLSAGIYLAHYENDVTMYAAIYLPTSNQLLPEQH